jgi:hypothetical protein
MAWFKKRIDPLSDRERALNQEIAQLEAQIRKLDTKLQRDGSADRVSPEFSDPLPTEENGHPQPEAPIFESVDQDRLKARTEVATPHHYNELGVRKYDLPALFQRIRQQFRGPSTTNPKLVSYLAAGGIQGLRPMRYEKRVARNRFIALVIFLFLMLLGIIAVFVRQ